MAFTVAKTTAKLSPEVRMEAGFVYVVVATRDRYSSTASGRAL